MEIKQITEALNYNPVDSNNVKIQAEFKKAAEAHQKYVDDWTKRETELSKLNEKLKSFNNIGDILRNPSVQEDQCRRHELRLEQSIAANAYKAGNLESASNIAKTLGNSELSNELATKSQETTKHKESAQKELSNFRESLVTQTRMRAVQDSSESWKSIVQANEQSILQSMYQTTDRQKEQQEFVQRQQDKRGLTNSELIPSNAQDATTEKTKAAHQSPVPAPYSQNNPAITPEFQNEMKASQREQTADRFQRYQAEGEIASESKPRLNRNYATSLCENALERRETFLARTEKRNEEIGSETNPVIKERLEILQELEHANYEGQTSRAASNICAFNRDDKTAAKMGLQADHYDKRRDEITERLYAFDKAHGLLPEQKEAALKISGADAAEQAPAQKNGAAKAKADSTSQPQSEGANEMLKSTEIEAPKNAAAARHLDKIKSDEAKNPDRSIGAKTQAIFAKSEERAAVQAEKARQSQQKTAQQKPASI